jgi:two-component system CheB/CheR fusion protein
MDLVGMCQRVMNGAAPESHELTVPDGTQLHVKVLPYLAGDAGMQGAIVSVIDVTEVKRGEERLQHILDSIPASLAVLGPDGTIVQVNAAWSRFAQENEAPASLAVGVGLNYLTTCLSAPDDPMAVTVARGLRDVLAGRRERFDLEYPCHSPDRRRFFQLQATSLSDHGFRGALLQHFDITPQSVRLERLSVWAEQVLALHLPDLPPSPV